MNEMVGKGIIQLILRNSDYISSSKQAKIKGVPHNLVQLAGPFATLLFRPTPRLVTL